MMGDTQGQGQARGSNDSENERRELNPDLDDLPGPAAGQDNASPEVVANVWWSDWANDELRLQQMRPTTLLEGFGQSSPHRTLQSGGVVAAQGQTRTEGLDQLNEGLASSRNSSSGVEVTAAATELIRQTSIGHYQLDLAEQFVRGSTEARRQEPEYFFLATPRSTPESSYGNAGRDNSGRQEGALGPC